MVRGQKPVFVQKGGIRGCINAQVKQKRGDIFTGGLSIGGRIPQIKAEIYNLGGRAAREKEIPKRENCER